MKIFAAIFLFLLISSCQKAPETSVENNRNIAVQPTPEKTETSKSVTNSTIDVPKLANKPAGELDKIFGTPSETKSIENGGEYRLYKISNYSKGLAVRFFGGKAKSFNLILDKPFATSKDALRQVFGIDAGNAAPMKDVKEPLTETFRGTFGNVKFSKAAAKKQENGQGFIFVLAELE